MLAKMHYIQLLCFIISIYCKIGSAKPTVLSRKGKNVCEFATSKTAYQTSTTKVTTLETYKACCSKFLVCWKSCERSRVKEKTISRVVSKLVRTRVLHCCEGYSVDASGVQCSKPICDPACENGGTCIEPNKCKCPRNFQGRFCQNDVNECLAKEALGCSQGCINIPGSYICTCRRGFLPGDPLSRTCKDIDECKANPCKCIGSNCKNSCTNTIGSYRCRCGNGYKLTLWNTCVDINECIENSNICPQGCVNTPGSYECMCWKGFRWNKRHKKCEEINECSIGNGGCHHICRNVFGGHICLCQDGFKLGGDRRSCIDINECKWETRCDPRRSLCINTPGSYYCKCKIGFKFIESHGICLDRDECAERTALCSQNCFNTYGSYKCGCDTGYRLGNDLKTCLDIDECQENRCEQVCVNTPGSFKCFCNQGYTLDLDEKSCISNLCERIQPLFFGTINCDGYSIGKKCTFSCDEGFHIDHDITRECMPSGQWSLQQPQCIPNPCRPPLPPPHGKLTLPCDFSINSTCPVSCLEGYVLRGPDLITCQISGGGAEWDLDNVKCEEILVCKPNPCKHGGKCEIVNPTTYACNCTGTGYEGTDCNIGIIDIDAIPKLELNRAVSIEIRAMPEEKVTITIHAEDSTIEVSPKVLTLSSSSKSARLSLRGSQSGLKSMSYEISSQAVYKIPKPSLVLVYDQTTIEKSRVSSISSLVTNCFSMQVLYKESKNCPNTKLYSTSTWYKRINGLPFTNGIGVLKVGSASFPLSLPASDHSQVFIDALKQLEYRILPQRSSCPSKTVNDGQLQYIAKMDIFAKDFVKEFNIMLPSWFQFEFRGNTKTFSEEMIRVSLVSGDKIKSKKHCSSLAIDENGIFITYLINEGLTIKIKEDRLPINTGEPLCLAVDICRAEPHFQFPGHYAEKLAKLLALGELKAYKWRLSFNTIGFGITSSQDTRKCMKNSGIRSRRMLFGNVKLDYKNQHGINAFTAGEMAVELKGTNNKEVLDSSTTCVDGHTLFESPTWKSTDLGRKYQERETPTNIVKITVSDPKPKRSVLSFLHEEGAVFKIKSGLQSSIEKTSSGMKFDLNYKVMEKSSSVVEGSNFDRYTSLQGLSFAAMDVESGFDMMFLSDHLTQKLEVVRKELRTMSEMLNADLDMLIAQISDSKLVLSKVKLFYNKGRLMYGKIEAFINLAKNSIDSETKDLILPALDTWKATLEELRTAVKEPEKVKEFEEILVGFIGSICLFKPCIEGTLITMRHLSVETPWSEYCYDPSKSSLQMWETTAKLLSNRDIGKFFSFTPDDRFRLCLSIHGVKKGEFSGRLKLLGDSIKRKFSYNQGIIGMPNFELKLAGEYQFRMNATMKTSYKRWDMLSLRTNGYAGSGSKIIQEFQNAMNKFVWEKFQRAKSRKRLLNTKLQSLLGRKGEILGQMNSNKEILEETENSLVEARRRYENNSNIHKEMQQIFVSQYSDFVRMKRKLDSVCKIRTCPYKCWRLSRCKVCQTELHASKTVLKCKEELEDRSYAYKSSVKGTCSHVVDDRRLKYTGNCKRPDTEINEAKRIVKLLKEKIDKKQELTLEDAWRLELVNKKQGQELRASIIKANFFKSFPDKLKEGWLSEQDFKLLRKYTNETFEKAMRENHKKVKLSHFLQELDAKSERGYQVTKEDIAQVRKYNSSLADILENTGKLKGVAEKLNTGKQLNEKELALLKKVKPKVYEDIQLKRAKQEVKREIFDRIKRKLRKGNLNSTDLEDLKKIDPKAAAKIEEGLKKQLRSKVNEMKSKLSNISNVISTGKKSRQFAILSKKLKGLSKGVKPFEGNYLKKLQERIKKTTASNGSIFEKVLQRLDLALEIQNITGRSNDFDRSLKEFFSTLGRFDMIKILMQSEKVFLESLEDLQMWFQTSANFVKSLCQKCGENCNHKNTLKKVLDEVRTSIGSFERKFCTGTNKIAALGRVCDVAKSVTNFARRYDIMKLRDCVEIKEKLLKKLLKISEEVRSLRRKNSVVFENLWKRSRAVRDIKQSYEAVTNGIKAALRVRSMKTEFLSPAYSTITNAISKIARTGNYNLKQTEYLVAKETMIAFTNATRLIPAEKRGVSTIKIAIPNNRKKRLIQNFNLMINKLRVTILGLCSSQQGKSMLEKESQRLKDVIVNAKKTFKDMLDAKDISDLLTSLQKVGAILEHALFLSDRLWSSSSKCTHISQSPLYDLEKFLNDARELGVKSVKELTESINKKFNEIGDGIKAPIGKLVDLIEKLAENTPPIDFPVIVTMDHKSAKMIMESFKKYLGMIIGIFEKFGEVAKKCNSCTLEEVFGSSSIGSIAAVLDKKLKQISQKLHHFISDKKFSLSGAAMIFSSLEQIRTDLQRIYKSATRDAKSSFKNIIRTVKTAKEGIDVFLKGQNEFMLTTAGIKNRDISTIVKELSNIKESTQALYRKVKDPKIEALFIQAKSLISMVPTVKSKLKDLRKGSVSQLITTLEKTAELEKDITSKIQSLYRSTAAENIKYMEESWLPSVVSSLDRIEEAKQSLVEYAVSLLKKSGILTSENISENESLINKVGRRKYSSMFNGIKSLSRAGKIRKAERISRKSRKDENLMKRVTFFWLSLYDKIVGKIDDAQARILKLREKFYQKLAVYKGIKNAVKEIKKGSISDIGELKDSIDGLVDSIDQYDLKKMFLAEPKVLKNKLGEVKQVFELTRKVLIRADDVIRNCASCSVETTLGYRYVKQLAAKVEKVFLRSYAHIEDFTEKFSEVTTDLKGMGDAVKSLRNRFQAVSKGNGSASNYLSDLASAFEQSKEDLDNLFDRTGNFSSILLGKDVDLQLLRAGFNGITTQLGAVVKRSSVVANNIEDTYKELKKLGDLVNLNKAEIDRLKLGPLETRISIAKDISEGVKATIHVLPKILASSSKTLESAGIDSAWVDGLGTKLLKTVGILEKVWSKTETVLATADILVKGKQNISKELLPVKESLKDFKNTPWNRKIAAGKNLASRVSGLMDTALDVIVEASTALNTTMTKEGLLSSLQEFVSHENIARVTKFAKQSLDRLKKLETGPISQVGKLTDSVDEYFESLRDFDIRNALLSDPASLKEKIGEFQYLADNAGDILNDIANITGLCKGCSIDSVLGQGFLKKISNDLTTTFDSLHEKAKSLAQRVKIGKKGVSDFIKTSKEVSQNFKKIFGNRKVTPRTFERAANELRKSALNLQSLKDSSRDIFSSILNDENDIKKLQNTFGKVVGTVSQQMKKAGVLSEKIEDAYETAEYVKTISHQISRSLDEFGQGPIELKADLARRMLTGVQDVIKSVPVFLKQSANVTSYVGADSNWMVALSNDIMGFQEQLETVFSKSDRVLEAAGIIGTKVGNITKSSKELKKDLESFLDLPTAEKFTNFNKLTAKFDSIFNEGIATTKLFESVVADVTGTNLNVSKGLSGIGSSLSGLMKNVSKGVELVEGVYNDITDTVKIIETGPVAKVGALKDSIEEFVDSIKSHNLAEILVQSPRFAKDKINDIRDIMQHSGEVLRKVDNLIKKHCPKCDVNALLGKDFQGKISNGLKKGFERMTRNVTAFLSKLEQGGQSLSEITNAVTGIEKQAQNLRDISFDGDGLRKASNILSSTSSLITEIGKSGTDLANVIFAKNKDLQKLTGKFEGFVTFVGGFVNSTGKYFDKISSAADKVDEIKKTFNQVKHGFDAVSDGPLEMRVDAVKKIANGLVDLTSEIPEFLENVPLGGNIANFMRGFGTQVRDIANSVTTIVNNTKSVIDDVTHTVDSISSIGHTAGQISNSFSRILNSPFAGKVAAVKDMVGQIKKLTGDVNSAASNVSGVVKKLTGKTILTSPLFGSTTDQILSEISSAADLVFDRYQKFDSLTKAVNSAFESLSSDPVNFALNDLPKLFSQADGFLSTLINDTKGIAAKLGLRLDGLSLDPELVSSAKEFYSFSKSTLGTIQNGMQLFKDFDNLFRSKDFVDGMQNFQRLIKTGGNFIGNLDDLGQRLFGEGWKDMKLDFQEGLEKIEDSIGINLKETGRMLNKGLEVAGDVIGIVTDVKKLLDLKELNLDTGLKAVDSMLKITEKSINLLNKLGAGISTKAMENIANKFNTLMAIYQIGKGVYDFIKWVNEACDITYKSEINKKELRYVCLKEKISIETVKVPVMRCKNATRNVTRGYGVAKACCDGKECVYVQSSKCLGDNARCMEQRTRQLDSATGNKQLKEGYRRYEQARQLMESAELDLKALERLKRRYQIAYNISIADLRMNTLRTSEARQRQALLSKALTSLKRVVNQGSRESRIRFIKAEFNLLLHSPDLDRIPLKFELQNHLGSTETVRFMMDFRNVQQSIKLITDSLVRKLVNLNLRKRRAVMNDKQSSEFDQAVKCTEFQDGMSFLRTMLQNLMTNVKVLTRSTKPYSRLRRTKHLKVSKTPLQARRQLIKEGLLWQSTTASSLKELVENWQSDVQEQIMRVYGEQCFDLGDCLAAWVAEISSKLDPGFRKSTDFLEDLIKLSRKVVNIPKTRRPITQVKRKISKLLQLALSLQKSASFCHSPPVLQKRLATSVTAYLGEELLLSCKVHTSKDVSYLWYLNETALPAFNAEELKIPSIGYESEGSYHCEATNDGGTLVTNKVLVSVRKRFSFLEHPESIAIPRSNPRPVRLTCNTTASEIALHTWWHQTFSGRIRKLSYSSQILTVNAALMSQNGMYWCEVNNGHMKLRSKKAVVALVRSSRKNYGVRLIFEGDVRGSGCEIKGNTKLIKKRIKAALLNGAQIQDYRATVLVKYMWHNLKKENGSLTVDLVFQANGPDKDRDLNLVVKNPEAQYKIQKIVNRFLYETDDDILRLDMGSCSYIIRKSDTVVAWDPQELTCPQGMGQSENNLRCESCMPGYFQDVFSACNECPRGTYQPRFGAMHCIPCGNGRLTTHSGSMDHTACISSDFKCYERVNMLIALDTTETPSKQSESFIKDFLKFLSSHFLHKNSPVKISLATFGASINLLASFDGYSTRSDVVAAVSKVEFEGTQRRTDLMLDLAAGHFEEEVADDDYKRVLLVISRGAAQPYSARTEEQVEKLRSIGVEIFYMTAGHLASREEAVKISSFPKHDHIFSLAKFDEIVRSSSFVANLLCNNNSS